MGAPLGKGWPHRGVRALPSGEAEPGEIRHLGASGTSGRKGGLVPRPVWKTLVKSPRTPCVTGRGGENPIQVYCVCGGASQKTPSLERAGGRSRRGPGGGRGSGRTLWPEAQARDAATVVHQICSKADDFIRFDLT